MPEPHDGPACPHCCSHRVVNIELDKPHNLCRDCGRKSIYLPTPATIRRQADALRAGCEPRGDASRKLDAETITRVRAFTFGGVEYGNGRQAAAAFGISYSSFQKIRGGQLIGHVADWCHRCRARINVWPCVLCQARRAKPPPRPTTDQRQFAGQPELAEKLSWPVSCLGLDGRTANMLERSGYLFVGHLLAASNEDLLQVPQVKKAAMRHVDRALARLGLHRDTPSRGKSR